MSQKRTLVSSTRPTAGTTQVVQAGKKPLTEEARKILEKKPK